MKPLSLLLFTVFIFSVSSAQQKKLFYDVVRNGETIGEIAYTETIQGTKKILSMTSNVETTLIFSFTDYTIETSTFDKGIMTYSTFYQKQTGSNELNKTTRLFGKYYKLTNNGESKLISLPPIRYNTLMLYINQPDKFNKAFSGNFQSMVDIKKIGDNKYRLFLPDDKYNDYTYKNGICVLVEVVRSMGNIQFVLRRQ